MQPMLEQIRADAAQRAGVALDKVKVLTVESVTWSDCSLGCPEPGMMYTQALVRRLPGPGRCGGHDAVLSRRHAEHFRALPAGACAGAVADGSDLIPLRCRAPASLPEPPAKENAPGISPRGA